MSRRLIDRKVCDGCGQVVETLGDGTEVGHAGFAHGPPAVLVSEPDPAPDGAADAAELAGAGERATLPAGRKRVSPEH